MEAQVGTPGQRCGDFVLERPVGAGGSAVVWRAHHTGTGRPAAVKLLRHGQHEAWEREVSTIYRLRHPAIVGFYDAGVTDGQAWIAQPWLDGGSLADHPVGDWPALLDLLRTLLDALAFAHGSGHLHRDVKPDNIMRGEGGWQLADFGISRAMRDGRVERARGTPAYVAPEQIRGDLAAQRPWTDLYAVATVAWEQATGRPVFTGTVTEILAAHAGAEPGPFRPRFPVPAGLEGWLRTLLRKAGHERAHFAADARYALDRLGPPVASATAVHGDPPPAGPTVTGGETFDLGAIGEAELVAAPDRAPLPPAPLPERPDVRARPPRAEERIERVLDALPYVPIAALLDPWWEALREGLGPGPARVVYRPPRPDRLAAFWAELWASVYGRANLLVREGEGVRRELRITLGARSPDDAIPAVRTWARCDEGEARAVARALDDDGPYAPAVLARFLARVAEPRGLVVKIDGPAEPERVALAEALAALEAPIAVVVDGRYAGAHEVPIPTPSDETVAEWLRSFVAVSPEEALEVARGRAPFDAWFALRERYL